MRRLITPLLLAGVMLGSGLLVPGAASAVPRIGVSTGSTTGAGFDKSAHSLSNPASYWVIVNKLRPLSTRSYAAKDLVSVPVRHVNSAPVLRKKASAAVVKMFADYHRTHPTRNMQSQSAYRSYSTQVSTYAFWVRTKGKKQADLQSARPGYSEHQTGLAIDISAYPANCSLAACFASTNQGKWLAKNAYKYGFVLRYPKGKTAITGYEFEPWHYRYVGVSLATELKRTHVTTLEEFFGLPAAKDYAK